MRYIVEIHDSDGDLVGIFKDIYNATLEQSVNAADILTFSVPAGDSLLTYMTPLYELWVRDTELDTIISKNVVLFKEDSR